MSKLTPKYTMWDGITTALDLGKRALEEIRTLARTPGPAGKDADMVEIERRIKEMFDALPKPKDGFGYDDIEEFDEDDGRVAGKRYIRDGVVVKEQRHQTKMVLFRGVHDHARVYQPGDIVSRGGSMWHCDTECKGLFNGDFWTLCVKHGRDGKD